MAYATASPDNLLAPFWSAVEAGRLIIQQCRGCGATRFPPTAVCPACLGNDQTWTEVSGKATLESQAQFHRAYWPERADQIPYSVCLVRLAEGPLMLSNLVDDEGDIPIGSPLEVCFEKGPDGRMLPQFKKAVQTE